MCIQERLDKEDLRIELSVTAMHKQAKQAVRKAANLEVSLGAGVPLGYRTTPIISDHHQQAL